MKTIKYFLPPILIVAVALVSFYFLKDNVVSSDYKSVNRASIKPDQQEGHIIMTPPEIKYGKGPESLPQGVKLATIEGDLTKAGPFTVRFQMPANYEIRPHFHPAIEHVTVLEGELYFGIGEKYDMEMAKKLPIGSVAVMPIGHKHYAFTKEKPATVQVHGMGPWGITYVNPQDDPRNKAMK